MKSNFNLSQFQSKILGEGLARTNRFEVLISPPDQISSIGAAKTNLTSTNASLVSLLCETCVFPPLTVGVKPLKIFGPTYQRPYTSEYGGDGISMQFHVDKDMRVKRFFDDWAESIVSKDNFTVAYQTEYARTIYVRQLDEQNNITYEIEILEAFPRSINIVELSNTAQNQTHRLNIIFAFRMWRRTDNPINRSTLQAVPVVEKPSVPFDYFTFAGYQDEYGNVSDPSGP